jgi:DNA polymerase (family 10)
MDARHAAQVLDEMGTILEVRGENPFRTRAYHNAAQALRALPDDLATMLADGRLARVPGIGATMLAKIQELVRTGRVEAHEQLKRETPPSLVALLRVPGLGPKKVKTLYEALRVATLDDLKRAIDSGQVAALPGFGSKTAAKIAEGIGFVESTGDRILQHTAWRLAEPLLALVRDLPGVRRADVAGSLRRRAETIGDLDLIFAADDPAPALAAFADAARVDAVLERGPGLLRARLAEGVRCDLRGARPEEYGVALADFTGSLAHNEHLRRHAAGRGLSLGPTQLEGPDGPIACADEAALYAALGLAAIPPELREDAGEIEAAASGALPTLVTRDDLTGTFHCHTDWSDGNATLEAMAEAAIALGLKYLGIADHSRAAAYAGGLSIERVRQQWEAIDRLNEQLGGRLRLYKGIECDILADGTLDYPDEVLAGFDYVVASVHSSFGQPRDEMTARIGRAAANPYVTMLGHPSGRLLLSRAAYAVDLDAVIAAAAAHGTMIEINANPHRLDLDAIHARRARQAGVTLVINPDAHATGELALLDYGVSVARRAWLPADAVFNTARPADVARRLEQRRRAATR